MKHPSNICEVSSTFSKWKLDVSTDCKITKIQNNLVKDVISYVLNWFEKYIEINLVIP